MCSGRCECADDREGISQGDWEQLSNMAPSGPIDQSRRVTGFGALDQGSSSQSRLLSAERLCRNVPSDIGNNSEGMDLSFRKSRPMIDEGHVSFLALSAAGSVEGDSRRWNG